MTTKRLRLILSATALAALAAVIVLCFSATSRSARIARLIRDPASANELTRLTDERDIRILAEYLCDPEPALRRRAVGSLAAIGPRAVKPTFDVAREVLVDPAPNGLSGFRDGGLYMWVTGYRRKTDRFAAMSGSIQTLSTQFGSAAVEPFLDMFASPDAGQRAVVLFSLARIHDARAFKTIVASLSSPDTRVRDAAIRALGLTGDPRALDILIGMYDDKSTKPLAYRASLVDAIANYRAEPRVVDRLLPLVDDPAQDQFIRTRAAYALADSTDSRIPAVLAPLVNDPFPNVRSNAIEALRRLGIDSTSASAAPLRLDLRKGPFAVRLARYGGLRVTVTGLWNPAGKEGGYVSGGGAQPAEPIYIVGSTPAALAKLNALYQLRPGAPLQITGTLRSYVPPAGQLDPTIQRPVAHLYLNAADITIDSPTLESSAP